MADSLGIPTPPMAFQICNRDAEGFERVVAGEILIPNQMCVYGDIYSEEQVKRFAYAFMAAGINLGFQAGGTGVGLDVEHDEVDYTGQYYIVESYIAKETDTDFTKGAWVVHCWIKDDTLWQRILDNDLVGFSFQAMTITDEVLIDGDFDVVAIGVTEPDLLDGHVHQYICLLDETGRVIEGSTSVVTSSVGDHSHDIKKHSVTQSTLMHTHRFNLTKSE